MKKNFSLWMLGIAAMLASCSQDETLQDATNHKSMTTITATIPDGMKTRADASNEDFAAIQRCLLTVCEEGTSMIVETVDGTRNGNNFTFSLELEKGNYDFYCWADDESYDLQFPTVSFNDMGIAHVGKAMNQSSGGNITIGLRHAVAKVVLQTTANITDGKNASVAVTKAYLNYNILSELLGNYTTLNVNKAVNNITGVTEENPVEVLSFYVLVDKDEESQNVTVGYGDDKITVSNVPIKADCCTILKGDLTSLSRTTVTASLDTGWDDATADVKQI